MKNRLIQFYDVTIQTETIQDEFHLKTKSILKSNKYVLGDDVSKFENQFSDYLGVSDVVSVNSGSDALFLAALALDLNENDIVFIQTNTYFATIESIARLGCVIELCEIDIESGQINLKLLEDKIAKIRSNNPTQRIVVIAVHLYGSCSDLKHLSELSKLYNFIIIEDAAQAHGSTFGGKMLGTFGLLSIFSFYPSKNLGAFGDGGAVASNCSELVEKIRALANHGQYKKDKHEFLGINSRLDTFQAIVLSLKLKYLDLWNQQRKHIADLYRSEFSRIKEICLLKVQKECFSNHHLFVIRAENRKQLISYLEKNNIQSRIHYPTPVYKQKAFLKYQTIETTYPETEKFCSQILSLPMYPGLSEKDINKISLVIKKFYAC